MDVTLDDALAEIDVWKNAVVDQITNLSPSERAKIGREAVAWLEQEIGKPLEHVAYPVGEPVNMP